MQTVVQNFVSGVILLVERSIKPGDILEVQGTILKVVRLGIRSTVARTREDEDIILPNSTLVQASVKNLTFRDPSFRIRVGVGVTYGSDMKVVREVLERVARDFEHRHTEPEPVILLRKFGNSSVDWEVSIWIRTPWTEQAVRSALHEAVWFALKERGITIAFPQVDVHFDPPVTDAVTSLKPAA
jgi:small-conductance mechanosensitive channel